MLTPRVSWFCSVVLQAAPLTSGQLPRPVGHWSAGGWCPRESSAAQISPRCQTGSVKPVSYRQWVSIFFAHNTFFREVFKGAFTVCSQEPLLSAGIASCCPGLFSVQWELRHTQLSPHYVASLFVASIFLDQIDFQRMVSGLPCPTT